MKKSPVSNPAAPNVAVDDKAYNHSEKEGDTNINDSRLVIPCSDLANACDNEFSSGNTSD